MSDEQSAASLLQQGARTPFVGRAGELGALMAARDAAIAGNGSLWLLVGEAGIGKTRLAQELAGESQALGVRVLVGRCAEVEGSPPYMPFVEALGSLIREQSAQELRERLGDDAPIVARLLPQIAVRIPDLPPTPDLSPETERHLLFEGVTSFLRQAAAPSGLLLVLEDLHWADRASLLLLQHLTRRLVDSRLMVLAAYRDVEVEAGHPLSETLANLRRDGVYQSIALSGLPEEHILLLVSAMGEREVRLAFARALHRQTEGNPLFVEEILRYLFREGIIRASDTGWTSDFSVDEMRLPESVKDVIRRRLARLSENCRLLLRQLAVFGREFRHDFLMDITGKPEDELLNLMDEALGARVIKEVPGRHPSYSFTHALMQQTLLEEISRARRIGLHRQIADAMERRHLASVHPYLPELAYHFFEAAPGGDVDKAIDYAVQAGDQALHQLAHEESARLYQMALAALNLKENPSEARRCTLLLALGDAQTKAGEVPSARETFLQAAEIARGLNDADALARAALGFGAPGVQGGSVLVGLLEEALIALGDKDTPLNVKLLARLSWELGSQGIGYVAQSHQRRVELSGKALSMAERIGDEATLAHALSARHDVLWGPQNTENRLTITDEIVRLAERMDQIELAQEARRWRAGNLLELGRIEAVDSEIEFCANVAQALRRPIDRYYVAVMQAMQALHGGRLGDAAGLARDALALGQQTHYPLAAQVFGVQMFVLRKERGTLAVLEQAARGLVDAYPAMSSYRASLTVIYAELGRERDARAEFDRLAVSDFADVPADWFWLITLAQLSEVCSFLGDAKRAPILYELLLPFAGRNITVVEIVSLGSAARDLGLLAATLGRWDEAERHFRDAIEMDTRMHAAPWLAWTQHDYARMLLARRHSGDRKRAYVLLNEALATSQALGLMNLAARITDLLKARRGLTPVYPDGLTRREVEVLRLLAGGKSNREISGELVLSLRTVERHITNVYSKIGARGRADATTYALNRDLLQPRP